MDVNVLSVISMLLGMEFGYAAFVRSKSKEDSEGGKLSGTLLTEIGYIRSGVMTSSASRKSRISSILR